MTQSPRELATIIIDQKDGVWTDADAVAVAEAYLDVDSVVCQAIGFIQRGGPIHKKDREHLLLLLGGECQDEAP